MDLARSYLLLNHGPVTLVTSAHGGRRNIMAASWAMPVDFDPPKVALVVDKATLTRELIDASGTFVFNIPVVAQAGLVLALGNTSGRSIDKFTAHGLHSTRATRVAAPMLDGCAAWLECRIIAEPHNQRAHDLFIAEVVAAHADPRLFSGNRWHFPDAAGHTLHYSAGSHFFATGPAVIPAS